MLIWGIVISVIFSISETPSFLSRSPAWLRLYNELVPLTAAVVATWLMTRYFNKDNIKVPFNVSRASWITGIVTGSVWIGLALIIAYGFQSLHVVARMPVSSPLVWVIALAFNTAMQELLVRGYLFKLLEVRHSVIVATIVTTVLFVGLHGPDFGPYGLGLLNVTTASLLFTELLMHTKGLLAPIIAHFIWNLIGGILLNVVVLAEDYPSYLHSTLSGASFLSGGAAKLEGSIVVFVVNAALVSWFYYRIKQETKAKHQIKST